jgi:hypothetical protein
MTGETRKERILRQVIVGLFLIGLAMTWAGRASATTFEKAINPNYSYLQDVQQTSDGGYVLGAVVSVTAYVALVVKLDSSGNLQWQKQYQFSGGATEVYALKQTSDGGYVWAGELQNSSGTDYALVVKLDSSGNVQWQQTYGAGAYATDIRQTLDGGYIVGGVTPSNPNVTVNGWLAKLDSSGHVQWQKVLASSNSSQSVMINSVIQTTDGEYTLTGLSNPNVFVAHFDSSGNVEWQTSYTSSSSYGNGYGIVQTSDGGYIVGGYDGISPFLALALKLSSDGHVQWAKTYQISGATSKFFSVRQTSDGGYALAGQFVTGVGYYYGYNSWIVKTDSAGDVQWQKAYGNTNYAATFQKVGLTTDGGLVAGGWTLEYNNQNEAYIVKTDSGGNVGNVNKCTDVQVTSGTAASLSETASGAKLSISTPKNIAGSGTVSESSTSFTLATECSGS